MEKIEFTWIVNTTDQRTQLILLQTLTQVIEGKRLNLNCSKEKPCLFHLRDDPHERRDLAAVNASMLHRVLRRLEALQRTVWHNCDPPSTCATIEPADYCANAHARHENTYGPMP